MRQWVRAPQSALRLKVTLKDTKPPVWPRLLVGDTTTLSDLHMAVQAAMGWENSHLHLFELDRNERYGDPVMPDVEDEAGLTVGGLVARRLKKFAYVYDIGNDWAHVIAVEGTEPIDPARDYRACIAGARACPPEDSGRVGGFADMLDAVGDPGHPRHAERKEWLGEFDPEAFAVEAADARVAAWFRRPKRRVRVCGGGGLAYGRVGHKGMGNGYRQD